MPTKAEEKKAARVERDETLLDLLGNEFELADAIYRRLPDELAGRGDEGLSCLGVGRILSRLATEGRCERESYGGFMWSYRRLT